MPRPDGARPPETGHAMRPLQIVGCTSALIAGLCMPGRAPAQAIPSMDCVLAGQEAERVAGLPDGLLLAIGRTESGRWNPFVRRTEPWPWTINAGGEDKTYPDKAAAIADTQALLRSSRDIDIGCFQISLKYHPTAFDGLDDAFDPQTNARYAASFLLELHTHLGTWEDAVAAYHSSIPELGHPYRDRVYAEWKSGTSAREAAPQIWSHTVAGVTVWAPQPLGTAPIHLQVQPTTVNLPVVIAWPHGPR